MNLFPGHPHRILLDETSWLGHLPGWLHPGDAASLLANLVANARIGQDPTAQNIPL